MQHRRKYKPKNTDDGLGSKTEKRKFQDVWKSEFSSQALVSWTWIVNKYETSACGFRVSLTIPITTLWLCIVMFVERLVKPNLSLEKKFNCESLVYHNKTKSLKHENCFNVVSEKPLSSNKYLLSHSGH